MKRDEPSNANLGLEVDDEEDFPDDRERQRRVFGQAFSSLSSNDFVDELPPRPPPPPPIPGDATATCKLTAQNRNVSASSRVIQYPTGSTLDSHAFAGVSSSMDEDDESPHQQNSFLKRLLLRSPLPKHRIPIKDQSGRQTVEYLPQYRTVSKLKDEHQNEETPLMVGATVDEGRTFDDHEDGVKFDDAVKPSLRSKEDQKRAINLAAIFLQDYEKPRQPTLPVELGSITDNMMRIHAYRYSRIWSSLVNLATISFFVASGFEGQQELFPAFVLDIFAMIIFCIDIMMQKTLDLPIGKWTTPLLSFMCALSLEMFVIWTTGYRPMFLVTSIPKPIALLYASDKVRSALEALGRIAPIVTRVLALEMLLVLSFATVACRLYSEYEAFHDLSTSWLSLFELSTTVVNPSMWMPMYRDSRKAAFFFVIFVTTTTLYFHSLVLSVVFQTYVQASTEIHERSISDREDAIRLAFQALQDPVDQVGSASVQPGLIQKTLRLLRPHYNAMKINALMEILNPVEVRYIDYPTFRTKIRQALNASIRSTPSRTIFAYVVEITAAVVAVGNFIYVMLLTSQFQADWFDVITYPAGTTITLLGVLELLARLNPLKLFDYTPSTRLNGTFDGMATLAAAISCWGLLHSRYHFELMLTGRAIDMIRIMRFQRIFRDVVRRSGDVIPALAGPLALVATTHHLFAYLGMYIWGGAVHVGAHEDVLTPLYDLNNFNSYWEGSVTMFQALVINDWHAIAAVYLYADRNNSPAFVYPFFILSNLICVSIMLNCLTAFFVGAFVTKLDDNIDDREEVLMTRQKPRDFSIDPSTRSIRKIESSDALLFAAESGEEEETTTNGTGSCGREAKMFEFDVYEREGFDKIMRTVAGGASEDDTYVKEICDMLELFESLATGRSRVGYMVNSQQTMSRFGNRRFQSFAEDFMEVSQLHAIISDMHAELLTKEGSVVREFGGPPGSNNCLQISTSLLRDQPATSLFVSRVI